MATAPEIVRPERARAAGARPASRRGAVAAGLAALVAVVGALLLPFAPVWVNEPTVTWPRDPARPEPTSLALTAYRPLSLDVRFSCDVARLAAATPGGVVVATALPGSPEAGPSALIVTAAGGRLTVRGLDQVLLDEPLPAGGCTYRITGRSAGLPTYTGPPPDPANPPPPDLDSFAGPDNAELLLTRDGLELARATHDQLPDVDVLVSSLTALPAGVAGQLAAELAVDDEFTSSPTTLKGALLAAVALAMTATVVLLARVDRAVPRAPRVRGRWRAFRPRVVDLAVPAVLAGWTFVAPITSDDGYFAAQSRNAALSGEVGNYYQFYDQSFVPFTWVYQALSWWQQLAGLTPVAQRVPALVLGIVLWIVLRRFTAAAPAGLDAGRLLRATAPVVLAVVYLSWWVPQNMGVRPEAVVALCGAAVLLAVLVAARRERLVLAWVACAVAGAGFTAHTTGVTMLAPLLAGLPLLWPLVRVPGDRAATVLRVLAVGSGAMTAPLLGFADGALRDFLRGQLRFTSALNQQDWTDELLRYGFLLEQAAMGNFAKRSAVLACLVALAWFAVLAVAARLRGVALPVPLWLAGVATALSFALLALTPSKWTHHLGSLAGVGPAFLALLLVLAVPLTRRVLAGSRLPVGVLVTAAGSAAGAAALTWHGPNSWPFAWLLGVRTPDQPPAVRNVTFDSPLLWAAVLALVALGLVVAGRRAGEPRLRALLAVPIVVAVSLAGTTAYAVGAFATAAARGMPPGSVAARNVADPGGCGAADTVRVLDPGTARALPAAGLPAAGPPVGFVEGAGFYANNRPQGGPGRFWSGAVWGSLVDTGAGSADRTTGRMSTGWYRLPGAGTAVVVTAAGTLAGGNELVAVYGRRAGDTVRTVATQPLTDTARSPAWRTFVLAAPATADVVRLDAADVTGDLHGWLGFTAPATATPATLSELVAADAAVALGWQLGFGYPCQRLPAVVDGVTEPPEYAVLWGEREETDGATALAGLDDIAWQAPRGGVFGQVVRSRSALQLATVGPVDPRVQVYVFGTDLDRAAYTVTTARRAVPGAETAPR